MSVKESKISLAYRLLLDRPPSEEDVTGMRGQHTEMPSLRKAFRVSDKFEKKYAQPNLTIVSGMPGELRAAPRPRRRALRDIRGHFSKGIGGELGADQRQIFDSDIAWDMRFYDVCQALFLPPTEARTIGT